MKDTIEPSSGVLIYISSFMKIGSGIQKLTRGYTGTQAHRHTDNKVIL
jgi:hypothetical protein